MQLLEGKRLSLTLLGGKRLILAILTFCHSWRKKLSFAILGGKTVEFANLGIVSNSYVLQFLERKREPWESNNNLFSWLPLSLGGRATNILIFICNNNKMQNERTYGNIWEGNQYTSLFAKNICFRDTGDQQQPPQDDDA